MTFFKRRLLSTTIFSILSTSAFAGDSTNGQFNIPTISSAITVDATLDEAAWQSATKISVNIEMSPGDNITAPVTTTAYIMADADTLYVAFKALDPNPDQIRAYFRERDQIWNDDVVGIKIDPYNDGNKAYQFFVNPLGVQSDAIENELIGRESTAWNVIWDAEAKITDQGYIVEMAIPLRVLNFEQKAGLQDWGIELVRFYPRDIKHRISNSNRSRERSCTLCQMTVAHGLEGIKATSQVQVVPTLTAGRSQTRDVEAGTDWQSDSNSDVGLDLKWAISPDVSLYATINPDFSQIEADSGQLNVNNSFSLFNEERRGFFLDDADFFEVPFQNLFYTRNVVAPKAGVKLAGRQGKHSFALFGGQDKETLFVLPGNLASTVINLDQEGTSGAFRYRFDASSNLSIGGLTTIRQSSGYHNYVGGIDVKYQPTDYDTIKAMMVTSNTQYPDDFVTNQGLSGELALRAASTDSFTGYSYDFYYQHSRRDWNANISYRKKSAGYRADLGFITQVDSDKLVIGGEKIWYLDNNWFNKVRFGGDWDQSKTNDGDLIEREKEIYVKLNGEYQSFVRLSAYTRQHVGLRASVYDDTLSNTLAITGNSKMFTEKGLWMWSEATPMAGVTVRLFAESGETIDLSNNAVADLVKIRPEFDWNITDHLLFKFTHRYRTLDSATGQIFKANLTDIRLTYQFNIRSSLRFSAVNLDIERDPSQYLYSNVDNTKKSLGTQLLYSYKVNPQTLFYLGYSDHGYQNDDLDKIHKDQRSVFAKFSYAWLN